MSPIRIKIQEIRKQKKNVKKPHEHKKLPDPIHENGFLIRYIIIITECKV